MLFGTNCTAIHAGQAVFIDLNNNLAHFSQIIGLFFVAVTYELDTLLLFFFLSFFYLYFGQGAGRCPPASRPPADG